LDGFGKASSSVRLVVKNRRGKKWLTASRYMVTGMIQLALASQHYCMAEFSSMDAALPQVAMTQVLGNALRTRAREALQPCR
jgi:hypothetical protein